MPEVAPPASSWAPLLSYSQLLTVVRAAAGLGFTHFRITGGEPLSRPGVVDFVREMARIPGVEDISLSTNGVALGQLVPVRPAGAGTANDGPGERSTSPGSVAADNGHLEPDARPASGTRITLAEQLAQAGLRRVNISLDSLRPDRFRAITRLGSLDEVWRGIEGALAAGLNPVKLNMVVLRGINDDEVADMARLTLERPLDVRFIELMPFGPYYAEEPRRFVSGAEVRQRLTSAGLVLVPVEEAAALARAVPDVAAGPARYYRIPGARGRIGFITAMSEHFCSGCNRLRLSAGGKLYPCLGDIGAVDLRPTLERYRDAGDLSAAEAEITALIRRAVAAKPERHHLQDYQNRDFSWREMFRVGG